MCELKIFKISPASLKYDSQVYQQALSQSTGMASELGAGNVLKKDRQTGLMSAKSDLASAVSHEKYCVGA